MTDKFIKGNICRIYMKNFLTYDEVEIFPTPNLNVVIGPNGTGKSSILCGICIGLGGKPELTGRGKSLIEYIKHGRECTTVEIELYNPKNENYIVRREFMRSNRSSKWFLHNKQVKEADVNTLVSGLGIHVNNLCQFLPQDRVVEFAKMNKIQLLSSTEKAVGEMQLFEQHEKLSQFGKKFQNINLQLKDIKNQLGNEVKKNSQLEDQIENIQKKESLDTEIRTLEVMISLTDYNNKFRRTKKMRDDISIIHKEIEELDRKMQPAVDKIEKIEGELKRQVVLLKKKDDEGHILRKKATELVEACENEERRIVLAKEEFHNLENSSRRRQREIDDLNKQRHVLMSQLENVKFIDENQINHQISLLTNQISEQSRRVNSINSDVSLVVMEKNALDHERQTHERKLHNLQNTKMRRLQLLQSVNRGAFQMAQWLQSHKHLFKAQVHEPLFALIDCTHEVYSKYLENVVSNQDLVAFVCEDKADLRTLKLEADKNRLPINIVHSPPVDPATFRSKLPIENLRNLGFNCFLKDTITGPDAIISFLCRNYNIHNIPIAEDERFSGQFEGVPTDFGIFFIGNQRFARKKSRYDNLWATNISQLTRPRFLTHSSNVEDEEILIRSLKELNQQIQQFDARKLSLDTEHEIIERELEKLREEKKEKLSSKNQRKQIKDKISQKEEQISRREKDSIDLKNAEIKMHLQIKKFIVELMSNINNLSNIEAELSKESHNILDQSFIGSRLNHQKRERLKTLEEDEHLKTSKSKEKVNLIQERNNLENQCRDILKTLAQHFGKTSFKEVPSDKIRTLQNNIKDCTLETLEDDFATKKAQRNCLVIGDDGVKREYDKRKEKIDQLKEEEEKIERSLHKEREDVEECQASWLPRIEELTENISSHFSRFMEDLECAGEVQLDKGKDENDFSQYGLSIKVKFRDVEKLKELTAQQQSGGERSVSTALYLMALQTLTAVPFRCVDEINQGMDPTNERKMFTMLVKSTTNVNASQYFLITPKLLPNLPYNQRVMFLNIFNWSTTTKVRHLSTAKILTYHKKKRARKNGLR